MIQGVKGAGPIIVTDNKRRRKACRSALTARSRPFTAHCSPFTAIYPFQPRTFPEYETGVLAAPVSLAVASKIQVDSISEAPPPGFVNEVTGLMCAPKNLKFFAAVLKHLGHKRKAIHSPSLVQCNQNLFFSSHFHPITNSEFHTLSCLFNVKFILETSE
jgi:hypothetical protein